MEPPQKSEKLAVWSYGSVRKKEMTMAHRAGRSVVENWAAVRRVPGSIPGPMCECGKSMKN